MNADHAALDAYIRAANYLTVGQIYLQDNVLLREPLKPEHGSPLRLASPTKYGIKLIKRIGRIEFTNERPRDYWAESGYDWYSGH